jgi:hypothetical protein
LLGWPRPILQKGKIILKGKELEEGEPMVKDFLTWRSKADVVCILLLPIIFVGLWIYGLSLKTLISVMVLLCVPICLIGSFVISKNGKFSKNDSGLFY